MVRRRRSAREDSIHTVHEPRLANWETCENHNNGKDIRLPFAHSFTHSDDLIQVVFGFGLRVYFGDFGLFCWCTRDFWVCCT